MSEAWNFIIQSRTAGVRVMKQSPGLSLGLWSQADVWELQNSQCACGQNYGVFHKKETQMASSAHPMGTEKEVCLYQVDFLLRSWSFLCQFPSAPLESKTQHMLCASCAGLHTRARCHFVLSQESPKHMGSRVSLDWKFTLQQMHCQFGDHL